MRQLAEVDEKTNALRATDGFTMDHPEAKRLVVQRDSLTRALVVLRRDMEKAAGTPSSGAVELTDVQRWLSRESAMLTFVELESPMGAVARDGDHWACILRNEGDPIWVRLPGSGDGGAWEAKDDNLHNNAGRRLAVRPEEREHAAIGRDDLARIRLDPLHGHLEGVTKLIVTPFGPMARIPIECLTDRYTVSYAPSATMYVRLRQNADSTKSDSDDARRLPALLALGDPSYENLKTDAARSAAVSRLPGTAREIEAIGRFFTERTEAGLADTEPAHSLLLLGKDASEQRLDELIRTKHMGRFAYLHIAAHGAMDDRNPWQSAVLLSKDAASASDDVLARALAGASIFDGRLTAEQIIRTWKLNAELVTLSACETALGKESGGEGFLGFSQALFVAGARSLVLSLWHVDDTATALLMQRFYQNLLGKFDSQRNIGSRTFPPNSPMPKAESLNEAKQWMRSRTPKQHRAALAEMGFDIEARSRVYAHRTGIQFSDEAPLTPFDYSDPHYWAGFILLGDPN